MDCMTGNRVRVQVPCTAHKLAALKSESVGRGHQDLGVVNFLLKRVRVEIKLI